MRRPPQSNCLPGKVPRPDDGARLETKFNQAGISLMAPPRLTPQLHSLPAMLHRSNPNSMPSYSKAPRGLFVLMRETSIFTRISISPGPSLRQCSSRYSVRAGRNLPDKEFRYLRTVIVTAAVHWGFGSGREALPLTFQHWAGVSPYTSPYGLAETCVFDKQSPEPTLCDPRALPEQVRSRSRVLLLPKLRSQLA